MDSKYSSIKNFKSEDVSASKLAEARAEYNAGNYSSAKRFSEN